MISQICNSPISSSIFFKSQLNQWCTFQICDDGTLLTSFMGVNIGDYAPGANAWIYFNATTSETTSSKNIIYRNIIQACGGYGEKEQSVDVLVDACET